MKDIESQKTPEESPLQKYHDSTSPFYFPLLSFLILLIPYMILNYLDHFSKVRISILVILLIFYPVTLRIQSTMKPFSFTLRALHLTTIFVFLIQLIKVALPESDHIYAGFIISTMQGLILRNCHSLPWAPIFYLILPAVRLVLIFPQDVYTAVLVISTDAITMITVIFSLRNPVKPKEKIIIQEEDDMLQKLFSLNIPVPVLVYSKNTGDLVHYNEAASRFSKINGILEVQKLPNSIFLESRLSISSQDNVSEFPRRLEEFIQESRIKYEDDCKLPSMLGRLEKSDNITVDTGFAISVSRITHHGQEYIMYFFTENMNLAELQRLRERSESQQTALSTVAHDLRTPLAGMSGMLDIAKKHLEEEGLKYIRTCESLISLQLNIVNTYLDGIMLNRQLKLNPDYFSIDEFLEEIDLVFGYLCSQKKIDFQILSSRALPQKVKIDRNRLKQILMNLISNSMKFTKANGKITLQIDMIYEEGHYIKFEVKDTGIGITPEGKARLFKAFSTLEEGSHMNPHGIGLGLIISNRIASLMNPNCIDFPIHVDSEYGKGTTFSFKIWLNEEIEIHIDDDEDIQKLDSISHDLESPANVNEAVLDLYDPPSMKNEILKKLDSSYRRISSSKVHHSGENSPNNLSGVSNSPYYTQKPNGASRKILSLTSRSKDFLDIVGPKGAQRSNAHRRSSKFKPKNQDYILVVDDEYFNVMVAENVLNKLGYGSRGCTDSMECISILEEKANEKDKPFFFCVLMDCNMPMRNGYETTKEIRRMIEKKEIPDVPIIGLTADYSENTEKACQEAGMRTVLTKPVSMEVLEKTLDKLKIELKIDV